MSYNVKTISVFEKQAKRLHKKYPSIKLELLELVKELKENPEQGTAIVKSCFKIRLAIQSKNKGKSGGARVITNVLIDKNTVYLLSVYDKGEQETISNKELDELLKYVPDDV